MVVLWHMQQSLRPLNRRKSCFSTVEQSFYFYSSKTWRIWPKTQWKRFLVHTASLDSFTLDLSTIQIFWATIPSGMLRTFKKLGEKRVFEHIFYHFMLILLKHGWKRSKIKCFHTTFWGSIAFPMSLLPKIFGRWIVQG